MRLIPQQDCPALKNAPSVSESIACGGCRDHCFSASHRAGETHARHPRIPHEACGLAVREVQILKHARVNAGADERFEKALGA